MNLSKSQYLRALQCQKSLWLYKYKRELQDAPSDSQLARFSSGVEVGAFALKLFDCTDKIDFDSSDFSQKIAQTDSLLKNGAKAIAEATFAHNGILVMIDILQITDDGLIINEVKSSTSVKPVHIDDLAIQYFVLTNAVRGLKVIGANLVHINSDYTRNGALELDKLFCKIDCLKSVIDKQSEVEQNLMQFEQILNDSKQPPEIPIDSHCDNPYPCDFKGVCFGAIPKENSVFNIARLDSRKKFALYHSGIVNFSDITDFSAFNDKQRLQIECALERKIHIDRDAIRAFLSTLRYPIYHLDFESFQEPVPSFDGGRPYMQVPFQYSLHIDYGDSRLEHREFLAECEGDPRESLAKSLVQNIPQGAFILAYNASFEKGVMKNLGAIFPQYAEILEGFVANVADLMTPFAQKSYYHYAMNGSYSIKAVLPALVPEMANAYKDLDLIHNGGEANEAFPRLKFMDESTRKSYRNALLEYCKLDTLAMVKVVEKLKELVL